MNPRITHFQMRAYAKAGMVFPVVELLRPIPPLASVPLAVLMMSGIEIPVIFVMMLASFFATVLNSYLGVLSINETYFRAASCLGFNPFRYTQVPTGNEVSYEFHS